MKDPANNNKHDTQNPGPSIAIIGAGFSGLCTAIQLKNAGFDNFTIFEKGSEVGGVWRENTYPGAACDVPWHLYSFSFEHRTDYSCPYPEQPEILEYQKFCATKYGIYPHVQFNTEVEGAHFDEATQQWQVRTGDGQSKSFNMLVTGVGQLSRPGYPKLKGIDEFSGHSFHSAEWDHAYDLKGKKVAVIGTGASAIQFVPEIAKEVAKLSVFQRTAPYLMPRFQRQYGKVNKWLFKTFPHYRDIFRYSIYGLAEASVPAFNEQSKLASLFKWVSLRHLRKSVKDVELRKKLTPDYTIGCKRILFSSNYFPALSRPNVNLVTEDISHVAPEGVVTHDGQTHAVDAIIYGTGFKATEFLAPMNITGREGVSLDTRWSKGAEAYKGITVDGFPNMFICYGPNTNLGGNSIIFMIECQVDYIVASVKKLAESQAQSMEIRSEIIEQYNRDLQNELEQSVWNQGCGSWYSNAQGRITNNWPGTNTRYRRLTKKVDLEHYKLSA